MGARSPALLRSAYLLTGDRHDAEDLVQTALVKLYVAWHRASAADSVEAYTRRIMLNTMLSERRTKRWLKERAFHELPEVAVADHSSDDRLSLWPHVLRLPPRQRAVVVLRYYEGLSEREIAEALGVSPGTVKSTASTALRALRQHLPPDLAPTTEGDPR